MVVLYTETRTSSSSFRLTSCTFIVLNYLKITESIDVLALHAYFQVILALGIVPSLTKFHGSVFYTRCTVRRFLPSHFSNDPRTAGFAAFHGKRPSPGTCTVWVPRCQKSPFFSPALFFFSQISYTAQLSARLSPALITLPICKKIWFGVP